MKPRFSIIVPVYNRPQEVADLAASLLAQSCRDFELIVVEDGSTVPCRRQIDEAIAKGLDAKYYYKDNEGRSIARNYGMERASASFFIFFDSDVVVPPDYFKILSEHLDKEPEIECFGGPDAAHDSFSNTQKAINYAMTAFLTTGGIRGGKVSLEKFTPRTFNMGFRRDVYQKVGGFREMFSEDIDMSMRIRGAGYSLTLIPDAAVWHKRRISFRKFARQVFVFGMSRITLWQLYPDSLKTVHMLPALAVVGLLALIVLALTVSWWFLLPVALYFLAILVGAFVSTRSVKTSVMAVPAAAVQIGGYGTGFIKAWFNACVLRRGRNIDNEIKMRKGK